MSFSGIILAKEIFPGGGVVHIDVDGRPAYVLPLDKDRTLALQGPLGRTSIEIRDHKVRITDSPCRNKLCIQQGWVASGTIICLPNRVTITVGGHSKGAPIDAATG